MSDEQLIAFAKAHAGRLSALPAPIDTVLMNHAELVTYGQGSRIFTTTESALGLFGLREGEVRFTRTSRSGKELMFGRLPKGAWFGEMAFIDGLPNPCDAIADTECKIAVVPFATLWRVVEKQPAVYHELNRCFANRIRLMFDWMESSALRSLAARLADLILSGHCSRLSASGNPKVEIQQEDLAAYLGVSRQSINRQLKLWEKDNLIKTVYGGLEVLNEAGLVQILKSE